MKKLLVLTAALALFAAPAFATIVGSPHDLSGGTGDLCGWCHTPHNAGVTATNATPLMNRGTGTVLSVCYSCHDGSDVTVTVAASKQIAGLTDGIGNLLGSSDHPVSGVVPSTAAFVAGKWASTVDCLGCHQVHDYTYVPFLKNDNAQSSICRECHAK